MQNELLTYLEARIYDILRNIGEKLKLDIQERLEQHGKQATGDLVKSITYNILQKSDIFILEVGTNKEYLKYIEEGREENGKLPPFSPIKNWVVKKVNKDPSLLAGYKNVSRVKAKQWMASKKSKYPDYIKPASRSISKEMAMENMTWAVMHKIKKHGIKPFPVLDFVLSQNEKWIEDEIKNFVAEFK
jgi:hypothetical protein